MKRLLWSLLLVIVLFSFQSNGNDKIITPYRSLRSTAMGGTWVTTGQYQDNFHGNPSLIMSNPRSKVTLFNLNVETSPALYGLTRALLKDSSDLTGIVGDITGETAHARVQMAWPGVYIVGDRFGFAFALLTSAHINTSIRNAYLIESLAVLDILPSFTFGTRLLRDKSLSLGATVYYGHRFSSQSSLTFANVIQGNDLFESLQDGMGDGGHVDFNLGLSYTLPFEFLRFDFIVGASIQNVLGGKYGLLSIMKLTGMCDDSDPCKVRAQPRAGAFGIKAVREHLWRFTDLTLALEVLNIGNNSGGSFFRMLHLGAETTLQERFKFRLGLFQGYASAGLGLDLRVFELNLTTFGEELALNTGKRQNRVVSLGLEFKI